MRNRNFRLLAQLTWVLGAALLCSALSSQVWERVLVPSAMGFLIVQLVSCVIVGLIAFRLGSRYARSDSSGPLDHERTTTTRKKRKPANRQANISEGLHAGPRAERKPRNAPTGKRAERQKPSPTREAKHEILTGTLKFYQFDNQYGFIEREGEPDLYFGTEGLAEGVEHSSLIRGATVSFWIGPGRRGPAAYDVQPIDKATQD